MMEGRRYGIANVLVLMRELPLDTNPDLVMRVVTTTLESNNVKVNDLIKEANARTGQIEEAIANERKAIADLEKEIATRSASVAKLGQERDEMKRASQRLTAALATKS